MCQVRGMKTPGAATADCGFPELTDEEKRAGAVGYAGGGSTDGGVQCFCEIPNRAYASDPVVSS